MSRVATFVYDDYYCHGIFNSFAGVYDDTSEARKRLRGDRFDKQNMETMDLGTLEIRRYRWAPLYEYHQQSSFPERGKETLTHSWSKDKPVIELVWDGDVRRYGHDNPFFDAGEWKELEG